jgi:hypothetical protein
MNYLKHTDDDLAKTAKMLSSVNHDQLETILAKMSDHPRNILAHAVKKVQSELGLLGPLSGNFANPNGLLCSKCGFDDCEVRNSEDDGPEYVRCGYCNHIEHLD